ncbi:MAG: hypothetical protein Q9215_008005 [Flavoplaca cf. flavocitrina]
MPNRTSLISLLLYLALSLLIPLSTAYDYEPGDELKRTFCYCTADPNNNDQTEWDPYTFLSSTTDRRMSYIYNFEYYNLRLNQRMVLECEDRCSSIEDDQYTRNKCINWLDHNFKCCGQYPLDIDPALGTFPHKGPYKVWPPRSQGNPIPGYQNFKYEFCYGMQGDTLKGKQKDWFGFDEGRRGLPRKPDGVVPREEIEATCEKMCVEKHGYFLFRPKYHVEDFNRGDWFHHFDDICTHGMDCKAGPGHVDAKHPDVTKTPRTYTSEASTIFDDKVTYSPYWKRSQTAV